MLIIDSKGDYKYLISSFLSRRVKLYLGKKSIISLQNINDLVDKQTEIILQDPRVLEFKDLLYHDKVLDDIIRKNILIKSILAIDKFSSDITIEPKLLVLKNQYNNYYQKDFVIEFVYNSNKIEGSKIPQKQIKQIIQHKLFNYSNRNEIREVINSQKVLDFLDKGFVFDQRSIKRVYHILTKDLLQENTNKYPRGYKKIDNIVGNHVTTPAVDVSKAMTKLLIGYQSQKKDGFPIQTAFDFHFRFERIHPFENGNGRVGRFLMNKILETYGFLPMIIWGNNREKYFNSFSSAIEGKKKKYYKFLLEQYKNSLDCI